MPPQPGGFDAQLTLNGTNQADRFYLDGKVKSNTGVQAKYFRSDLTAQLRLKGRVVLTGRLPISHAASSRVNTTNHRRSHGSNGTLGARILIAKPGLLDKRHFLFVGTQIITPVVIPRINPGGLATGFPSYALETGIGAGKHTDKYEAEVYAGYGYRVGGYSGFYSAFGKFSIPLRSTLTSLTFNYLQSQRDGTQQTPPIQIRTGFYTDQQSYLTAALEYSYAIARFYGIKFALGRTLTGHQIAEHWSFGAAAWVKW